MTIALWCVDHHFRLTFGKILSITHRFQSFEAITYIQSYNCNLKTSILLQQFILDVASRENWPFFRLRLTEYEISTVKRLNAIGGFLSENFWTRNSDQIFDTNHCIDIWFSILKKLHHWPISFCCLHSWIKTLFPFTRVMKRIACDDA